MTDDHTEPVHLGDDTVLVGDAARQYRAAFTEGKTVPLRAGDRIVGTAHLQADGTAQCTVTDPRLQELLRADLTEVSMTNVKIHGLIDGSTTESDQR